jgi:uncharacterized protein with ATP-grasp and redox domains
VAHLRQLADPQNYRRSTWDLRRDPHGRAYWTGHFLEQLTTLVPRLRESYPQASDDDVAAFVSEYSAAVCAVGHEPDRYKCVDVYMLDAMRSHYLSRHGFCDPYRELKDRQTQAALGQLPAVLRDLDARSPQEQPEMLARGLLTGNLFDVGAEEAMRRHEQHDGDFVQARRSLAPRPWWRDGLDAWTEAWGKKPYVHVGWFVDNAGWDICLGVLPMARWMLGRGARVTLIANSGPALNDITADALSALLDRVAEIPGSGVARGAAEGCLAVAASGESSPLVDLSNLSPCCAQALADADLIVLHGMGRAMESNWDARLACDVLRTAILKDPQVAAFVGGRLFDCLFDFRPAGR